MAPLVTVAQTSAVQPGEGRMVEVAGHRIALFATGTAYYAIDDTCTHRGCPLSKGTVHGEAVTCPCHGSVFDLRTGTVLHLPATAPVQTYRVVVEGQDIKIDIP